MMKKQKHGFTLVEIMVSVVLIGLLATISIPAFNESRQSSRAKRIAREFLTAQHAFEQFSMENDNFPADVGPAQIPSGMADYLAKFRWNEDTIIGGQWDWDNEVFGITAGVSISSPNWDDAGMVKVDQILDDGNLGSGQFRSRTGGYIFIIEE